MSATCPATAGEDRAPRWRRVEVLACDWNGTCVDDVTRAWRATAGILRTRGLEAPDLASFLDAFSLPLGGFFRGLGVAEDHLAAAEAEWNEAVAAEPALPMPGLPEMLDALEEAGVAVGVVSAAGEEFVRAEAAALGLEGLLAFVAGSASPKREALSSLVGAYGEGRVAYLGDTEHDVEEALAAGALAIGFGGGYRPAVALAGAGAHRVVSDLRAIPALLLTGTDSRFGYPG